MRRRIAYHSAMRAPEEAPICDRVVLGNLGVAFRHDLITEPRPPEFNRVTAWYMEPPWPHGFGRFNDRAGVSDGRTYKALMGRVGELIEEGRPTYIMLGNTALKMLPPAHETKPAQLWSIGRVICAVWHDEAPVMAGSMDIVRELAGKHRTLGDPFCGYGVVGREAMKVGAGFVLSDYDPRCIGHIAMEAKSW